MSIAGATSASGAATRLPFELRLLALCCAWPPSDAGDETLRAAAEGFEDWERFVAAVARHRVPGLASEAMVRAGIALPARIAETLQVQRAQMVRQNLRYAAETVRLQQRLRAAGIEACFFKGATLAVQAYGSLAIKHAKDIDFVVAPSDVQRCVHLLGEDGYRLWSPAAKLTSRQWRALMRCGIEVAMLNQRTSIQVEPHWRIGYTTRLLRVETMRTREIPLCGEPIRTFEAADEFAYLCLHGAASGWLRLKWLADLNALLGDAAPSEVARLHARARVLGVGPAATLALMLRATIFGRPIPAGVLDSARPCWSLRQMRRMALRNLAGPERMSTRRQVSWSLLNGHVHDALGPTLRSLAVGFDPVTFPVPPFTAWIYPILRLPLWLWRRRSEAAFRRFLNPPPVAVSRDIGGSLPRGKTLPQLENGAPN